MAGRFDVHLVDGTYELFRHHHALPSHRAGPMEVAAARGVARSLAGLLEEGATHLGVATDHVIESFRNAMYPGYKTGEGIEPDLLAQFPLLEELLEACGLVVWRMTEFEADDALAAAAARSAADPRVRRVHIATPDKDLAQCVRGDRVVQLDRRKGLIRTADDVVERFGVPPAAIPDYLALVGDTADGYPGLPGWGAKSAAVLLARYGRLEDIPDDASTWDVRVRGGGTLGATLAHARADAMLFRELARLREDVPVMPDGVDGLRWRGPSPALPAVADRVDAPELPERLDRVAERIARAD
ncbi:MAG: flap endonuclease [Thermoleophilia bacterium]|nr:flap endonuclease [Thermoleophilia bacterium]